MGHIFIIYTAYLDAYNIQAGGRRLFTLKFIGDGWRELHSVQTLSGVRVEGGEREWPTKRQALDELMQERGYTIGRLLDGDIKWEVARTPSPVPNSGAVAGGPMEDAPLAPSTKDIRSTPVSDAASNPPLLRKRGSA